MHHYDNNNDRGYEYKFDYSLTILAASLSSGTPSTYLAAGEVIDATSLPLDTGLVDVRNPWRALIEITQVCYRLRRHAATDAPLASLKLRLTGSQVSYARLWAEVLAIVADVQDGTFSAC